MAQETRKISSLSPPFKIDRKNGCERCAWGVVGPCGRTGIDDNSPDYDIKTAFEFMQNFPHSNQTHFHKWCEQTIGQETRFCDCLLNNACWSFGTNWIKGQRWIHPFCDWNWDEC